MPTTLNPKFQQYLDGLVTKKQLTPKSRRNYGSYVTRIEKWGSGNVDAVRLSDPKRVLQLIAQIANGYDANPTAKRKHKWNKYRTSDTKTVLRHYLDFLKLQGGSIEQTQDELEQDGSFDASNAQQAKEKVLRSIALRRGQRKFRNALLAAYDGKCAVTRTAIEDVLEAAHILPYSGESTNHICNGLLLRSDIHALFDLGLLSVSPDTFTVYCSKEIRAEPFYATLHGATINLPTNPRQRPDTQALKLHFEKRVC